MNKRVSLAQFLALAPLGMLWIEKDLHRMIFKMEVDQRFENALNFSWKASENWWYRCSALLSQEMYPQWPWIFFVRFHLPNPPQQSHQTDCKELLITYNCARANHCTFMTPSWMKMVIPHFQGLSFISNILANFFPKFQLMLFAHSM